MKQNKFLLYFLVFTLCFLPVLEASASNISAEFLQKLFKKNSKTINKLARNTPKKHIPEKSVLSKTDVQKQLPSVNVKKLTPEMMRVARMGKKIADKGPFSARLINKSNYPTDIIRQNMLYGDNYLKVLNISSDVLKKSLPNVSKTSFKALKNIPADKLRKFKSLTPDALNDSLVNVLKRTGKKGYKAIEDIANFAVKHPKTAISAALLTWYALDPEEMLDSVKDVGVFLGQGIGEVTAAMTEGVFKGISSSNPYLLIVLGLVLIAILVRYLKYILKLPFAFVSLFKRKSSTTPPYNGSIKNNKKSQSEDKPKGIF